VKNGMVWTSVQVASKMASIKNIVLWNRQSGSRIDPSSRPGFIAMPSASANRLCDELKGYGVAPGNVRFFGQKNPKPDLQEYLTLTAQRRENQPAPDGVAEHQGRPVLYFVDEQRLAKAAPSAGGRLFREDDEPAELLAIFRQLACRGERAYLARIEW